jgi:hypothetical protein
MSTTRDSSSEPGWITYDGWVFLFAFFLGGTFGLPILLAHTLDMGYTAMGLYIGGAAVVMIGDFIAEYLGSTPDDEY